MKPPRYSPAAAQALATLRAQALNDRRANPLAAAILAQPDKAARRAALAAVPAHLRLNVRRMFETQFHTRDRSA
jgi:hypothetical protein